MKPLEAVMLSTAKHPRIEDETTSHRDSRAALSMTMAMSSEA